MKNNSLTLDDLPSIPFKDFRNEEIADFFANENQTFHPLMSASDGEFGRQRLVGTSHFHSQRKGTAAFRSVTDQETSDISASSKTQTILLTEKLFEVPPGTIGPCLVLQNRNQEDIEYPSVIMPFRRPTQDSIQQDSVPLPPENETEDIRLTRLIAAWSELPERIKETITALLDTV